MSTKTSLDVRERPNILITGVPCVGKTTIAKKLAEITDMIYYDVNDAIIKYKLHSGFDDEYMSFMLDEDRFLDHLEVIFMIRDKKYNFRNTLTDLSTLEVFLSTIIHVNSFQYVGLTM